MKMHSSTGITIILLCCVLWISSTLGQRSRCDACGRECLSACGSPHFKTCCYNYLRKRNGGEAPHHPASGATLEPTIDLYKNANPTNNNNNNINNNNNDLISIDNPNDNLNNMNNNNNGLNDNNLDTDNVGYDRYNEEFVFAKIIRDPRTGHLELVYTK